MRRSIRIAAAALALFASSLAHAQTPEQQAEWDKVVEAAKKEGTVTLYSGQLGVPYHPEIARLFTEKYGIGVEILEGRASEILERIRTEQTTNRVVGDFSHSGGFSSYSMEKQGFYQPHGWLPNAEKLKEGFETDGTRVPIYLQPYGILVNSNLVPENERPRSWKDLLDPKWKGKILADDFRALGGGGLFFDVTYRTFGREYHDELKKQDIVFSRQIRENPVRVARGEYLIYIPLSLPDIVMTKGLPIAPVSPEEGLMYVVYDVAVFNDAQHPNASKLLVNFFLEDEAQAVYARSGRGTTIKGGDKDFPAEAGYLDNMKLLDKSDVERTQEMLQLATEIYGR